MHTHNFFYFLYIHIYFFFNPEFSVKKKNQNGFWTSLGLSDLILLVYCKNDMLPFPNLFL